jgi:hypothetical protein
MSITSTGLGDGVAITELEQFINQVFPVQVVVSIKEMVAAGLGGRSRIYDKIAARKYHALKDGASLRVTVASIKRDLAALPIAAVRPGHTPKPSASRAVQPAPQPKKPARGPRVRRRS